jgi:hypothetical protein
MVRIILVLKNLYGELAIALKPLHERMPKLQWAIPR